MIPINVIGTDDDTILFHSDIPRIPNKGEHFGFWLDVYKDSVKVDEEWVVAEVVGLIYEFDECNNFVRVEITVNYEDTENQLGDQS